MYTNVCAVKYLPTTYTTNADSNLKKKKTLFTSEYNEFIFSLYFPLLVQSIVLFVFFQSIKWKYAFYCHN